MKQTTKLATGMLVLAGFVAIPAMAADFTVRFQPGATNESYVGALGSGDADNYYLNAQNGQDMLVSLSASADNTFYIVYAPDGEIMFESAQGGDSYDTQLWQSGDHRIEIFYNGNAGTTSNYSIYFEVGATGAAASGDENPGAINERACLNAVAAETGNTVTVLSTEFSEANTLVMVGVGPQLAPWRCLVSNGIVAEIMFDGDEGRL